MIAVDTNVLLRYLLQPQDHRNPAWQAQAAHELIHTADQVYISDTILAELEWVLEGVFQASRKAIIEVVSALVSHSRFVFDDWEAVYCAWLDYQEHPKVDLSDCLIAQRAIRRGLTLHTFEGERKLGGLAGVKTLKPPMVS
jgi:predicted nucleic-acid-binding protein